MTDETKTADTYKVPNQNPWYVLATLYGEGTRDAHKKNRVAWNAWVGQNTSRSERVRMIRERFSAQLKPLMHDIDELNEFPSIEEISSWEILKDEVLVRFQTEWKLRNGHESAIPELPMPEDTINLSGIKFDKPLTMNGFVFKSYVNLSQCRFEGGLDCKACVFFSVLSLKASDYIDSCVFSFAYFSRFVDFSRTHIPRSALFNKCIFNKGAVFTGIFDSLDFSRAIFHGKVNFNYAKIKNCNFELSNFMHLVTFVGSQFFLSARFNGAKFHCNDNEYANFSSAVFEGDPDFGEAIFGDLVLFQNSKFLGQALFRDSTFQGRANFNGVIIRKATTFRKARFLKGLSTIGGTFGAEADFFDSTFKGNVNFSRAVFRGPVNFDEALFEARSNNYAVVFSGCTFRKPLSFREAKFSVSYPIFSGAALPENVFFSASDKFWPNTLNQNKREARESVARIRHLVDKQGFVEDAQFFYRREMMLSRQIGSFTKRLPFSLYGFLSNYGESIRKPFMFLFCTWLMGFIFLFGALNCECFRIFATGDPLVLSCKDWNVTLPAGVSLSNSLPFLGMNRVMYSDFFKNATFLIKLVSISQALISVVFVFLIALGFRNRFRMK